MSIMRARIVQPTNDLYGGLDRSNPIADTLTFLIVGSTSNLEFSHAFIAHNDNN